MKTLSIATAMVFGVFGVACASGPAATGSAVVAASAPAAEPASAVVGAAAPGFSLPDSTGKTVSLSDYAGKIVVLEWVNPECPFVKRHADAGTMKRLAEKYDGQVVWLGINSSAHHDSAFNAKWISDRSLPYAILNDQSGAVGRSYNARTTPHMFVIDASGKLAYAGAIDDDSNGAKGASAVNYVDAALAELTAGKPVTVAESKPYGCSVKYAK